MLLKSDGDKIGHSKKWWGYVPSVPSVNDTYAYTAYSVSAFFMELCDTDVEGHIQTQEDSILLATRYAFVMKNLKVKAIGFSSKNHAISVLNITQHSERHHNDEMKCALFLKCLLDDSGEKPNNRSFCLAMKLRKPL